MSEISRACAIIALIITGIVIVVEISLPQVVGVSCPPSA